MLKAKGAAYATPSQRFCGYSSFFGTKLSNAS